MHCHLHLVSTSLLPTTPHAPPFPEHNPSLTYENSPLPIISSTIHIPSSMPQPFRIHCSRDGDASDVNTTDLSFEIFIDGIWISSTSFRQRSESRIKVPPKRQLLTVDDRTICYWIKRFFPFVYAEYSLPYDGPSI